MEGKQKKMNYYSIQFKFINPQEEVELLGLLKGVDSGFIYGSREQVHILQLTDLKPLTCENSLLTYSMGSVPLPTAPCPNNRPSLQNALGSTIMHLL